MTSAAGNPAPLVPDVKPIKYQVSEYLKDRHPYQPTLGFHQHPTKYEGKVFNGFGKEGISTLMMVLNKDEIQNTQKVLALRHLFAHIASQEMKIKLIREGIIPALGRCLKPDSPPEMRFYVAEILWNLASLPQGAHALLDQGGFDTLVTISKCNGDEDREGRASAVKGLSRIALSWEGRSWLLGKEVPQGLALNSEVSRPGTTQSGPEAPDAAADMKADSSEDHGAKFTEALVGIIIDASCLPETLCHAVDALAHFSLEEEGLLHMLDQDVFNKLGPMMDSLGSSSGWLDTKEGVTTGLSVATIIWHSGLNETCRVKLDPSTVSRVGLIMTQVMYATDGEGQLALKAALSGALSSISLHPPLKTASLNVVTDSAGAKKKTLDILVLFLEQANSRFDPLYKHFKETGRLPDGCQIDLEDLKAVMKNCVQAMRLITEFPEAAEYLEAALQDDSRYRELKRQCYASTQFEERFGVIPL